LHEYQPVKTDDLFEDLNTVEDEQLYTEAMGKALTLLKNENEVLPLKSEKTIGHLALGEDSSTVFLNQLKKYGDIKSFKDISVSNALEKTASLDTLIVSFHRSNENPWKASDFSEEQLQVHKKLAQYKTLILAVFVKPYALAPLERIEGHQCIVDELPEQFSITAAQCRRLIWCTSSSWETACKCFGILSGGCRN
jgi:hypothetical protein